MSKSFMLPDIEKHGTISSVSSRHRSHRTDCQGTDFHQGAATDLRVVCRNFNDKMFHKKSNPARKEHASKQLLEHQAKNFGVIADRGRSKARGRVDAELKVLLKHWEETITKVQKATKLPSLVYANEPYRSRCSDLFNPVKKYLHANDETVFNE